MSIGASSSSNLEANSLLGFTYQDDEEYYGQNGGQYSNSYGAKKGKRRGGGKNYRPSKDYSVQSAFKFILKGGNDYLLNLYDPNENVDWKDVVQVIFNMINASDV